MEFGSGRKIVIAKEKIVFFNQTGILVLLYTGMQPGYIPANPCLRSFTAFKSILMHIPRIFSTIVLLLPFAASGQAVLYVSPQGSGTAFSKSKPGSLQDVRAGARKTTVYLKGGTYMLSTTLHLTQSNITFTSAPGEKAIISGGIKVTGWTPAGNGIFKATLPAGSRFRQLYVNGQMAVRARTPNREHAEDYGPYLRVQRFDEARKAILLTDVPVIKESKGVEMVINQHWYQSRVRIASIDKEKDTTAITVQEPEKKVLFGMTGNKMLWPLKPFYFENALEFLDAPDEWFLDANTLYYKPAPGKDITKLSIIAPGPTVLVQVSGTETQPLENITFKNIGFAFSNWLLPDSTGSILTQGAQLRGNDQPVLPGLIQVAFARNFQIDHCVITGAGANGIVFSKGVWDSKIINSHLHEISANAIVIDTYKKANPPQTLQCRNNLIAQNLIEHIGLHYTNGMGLIASCVAGLIVEHNEIRYGRYSGMQIGNHYGDAASGTQDNLIRYNNIHHVMLLHDDGGAIYTLSNQKGTQIYGNWIHDYTKCSWADNYPVNGVFLDNNSAFIVVKDNVFTNLPNVDHLKENKGTKVHDNIFQNNESQDQRIIRGAGISAR